MATNTVLSALTKLTERGHIKPQGSGSRRRAYFLTASIFGGEVAVVAPVEQPPVALPVKCCQCARRLRRLPKGGACRDCVRKEKIRRKLEPILQEDGAVDCEAVATAIHVGDKAALEVRREMERMLAERG